MTLATDHSPRSARSTAQLRRRRNSARAAWPSGSARTPFFAYDRGLLTQRVELLRAALPARDRPELRDQGQPDAGGRAAPRRRWSTRSTSPRRCEMRTALDTPMPPDRRELRRTGQDRRRDRAGGRRGRHHRDGVGHRGCARASRAGERLGIRPRVAIRVNPDFARQGLRHAHGRRTAAVRRRRRAGARAARASSQPPTSTSSASTSSPARRTCSAEILVRGAAARPSISSCELAERLPAPIRYVNLGGGFGIPYFEKDEPLDLAADRRQPGRRWSTTRSVRAFPTRRSVIELGRYIVGECGVYVTRVVDRKESRGTDVSRGRRRHAPPAGRLGQLRPGDPAQLPDRDRQPGIDAATGDASPWSAACAPRWTCSPTTWSCPDAEIGDLVVVFQAGRLRPHRQPDRLPRPPRTGRGAGMSLGTPQHGDRAMADRHARGRQGRRRQHARHRDRAATLDASTPALRQHARARLPRGGRAGRSPSRTASASRSRTRTSPPRSSRRSRASPPWWKSASPERRGAPFSQQSGILRLATAGEPRRPQETDATMTRPDASPGGLAGIERVAHGRRGRCTGRRVMRARSRCARKTTS